MKKILLLVFVVLFTLNSCKKIDKWTQFTMEYDQETTIDATIPIPIGLLNIPTPNITTNSESTFKSENTHKDLVEEARLEKLTLTVLSPNGGTFSFLESVEIYLSAEGLDEIIIASNTNVEEEVTIELDPKNQNLEAYIKKDVIHLRVETITDELLTQDYTINIHAEFYIDAKVLGV